METNRFLRIETARGNALVSANIANGFRTDDNTFSTVSYLKSWNQTKNINYDPPAIAEGFSTSVVTNKLVDSNADFVTAGVSVGDIVTNVLGNQETVTAIDSATQLSLSGNAFASTDIIYLVYSPNNWDLESNLNDAMTTVFSQKWKDVVIDVEIPEGMIVKTAI